MKNNSLYITESELHDIIANAVNRVLTEASDRSEYWKQRWQKQKEEGTVPDRSTYWKERAKKQKEERLKKQQEEKKQRKKNKRINKATNEWEWLQWHHRTFGYPDPEWEGDYSYGDFYPGDND